MKKLNIVNVAKLVAVNFVLGLGLLCGIFGAVSLCQDISYLAKTREPVKEIKVYSPATGETTTYDAQSAMVKRANYLRTHDGSATLNALPGEILLSLIGIGTILYIASGICERCEKRSQLC